MSMLRLDPARELAAAWRSTALPALGGGGFGALMRQTGRDVSDAIAHGFPDTAPVPALTPEAAWLRGSTTALAGDDATRQAFLERIAPYAQQAGLRLGVAPRLVAAHAALESGWGQRPLAGHNLFGIKAEGWQGAVLAALTTEHEDGADVKRVQRFRAYDSLAQAFDDYAGLLGRRYRGVVGVGDNAQAFAQALAAGGYATDPDYAAKLQNVARSLR